MKRTELIHIRINKDMKRKIQTAAHLRGVSLSSLMKFAAIQYLSTYKAWGKIPKQLRDIEEKDSYKQYNDPTESETSLDEERERRMKLRYKRSGTWEKAAKKNIPKK